MLKEATESWLVVVERLFELVEFAIQVKVNIRFEEFPDAILNDLSFIQDVLQKTKDSLR